MPPVEPPRPGKAVECLSLVAFHGVATLAGAVLFLVLNRALAKLGVEIMFYRGVIALAFVFVALLVLFWFALRRAPAALGLSDRDSIGGALVATSLLLAAFVLGPITVDRSISVFMLTKFEQTGAPMTRDAARDAFVGAYVDDWRQIDRRLHEQEVSGNLVQTPAGWELTAQGRAFLRVARVMSAAFGGDPRFVGLDR